MHLTKNTASSENATKSAVGFKIQKLLNDHGLSVSKVAIASGVTSETIRQIINGTIKNPGIETLIKIADAFSISLSQLLETKDVSAHINKKTIKIVDLFELQKLQPDKIDQLIDQSVESTEMLYIDFNIFDSQFFAVQVDGALGDKLTNCGMPMVKNNDLLIFVRKPDCSLNSLILVGDEKASLIFGIAMELEGNFIWVKSVDVPQKQIVVKVKKENIVGVIHNVQFAN